MGKKQPEHKVNRSQRGSMTVEAVIALPVFVMLFMFMMYMVNVCHIYLTLNHAADQTVKFNANNAYVYSVITGFTDVQDNLEENAEDLEDMRGEAIKEVIMSGGDMESGMKPILDVVKGLIMTAAKGYFDSALDNSMAGLFEHASKTMLMNYAEDNQLDKSKLDIVLFKLPGSEMRGSEKGAFTESLGEEDILVRIEYRYTMNIPLIGIKEFPIVSTCVEKAWINGSSGEYMGVEDESFFGKLL